MHILGSKVHLIQLGWPLLVKITKGQANLQFMNLTFLPFHEAKPNQFGMDIHVTMDMVHHEHSVFGPVVLRDQRNTNCEIFGFSFHFSLIL